MTPPGSAGLRNAGSVAFVKWAASGAALATGFRAVSDDDYARVVIAEQWAHTPHLDPSGTSWLPLPFWVNGAAMVVFGRSLSTARGVALVLGIAAMLLVYRALRWLGEERAVATAGAVVASLFPWSARLGAATVPELPAAALTLLGMASLGGAPDGARATRLLWGGAALGAACLSRYEAWPVAVIFAALAGWEAARTRSGKAAGAAALALAGPAAWMAWNRVAHGSPLHFLERVARYRQALGGDEPGAASRLVTYPVAMIAEEPEIVVLLLAALLLLALRAGLRGAGAHLRLYAIPFALAAAQIAALSLAMVKDGAPTHHPERVTLTALLLVAACGGALALHALRRAAWLFFPLGFAIAVTMFVMRRSSPREGLAARQEEEAAGRLAARLAVPGETVLVEVPDYGYLAVIAALGRPEDAVPDRSIDPRDPKVLSSFDDTLSLLSRVNETGAHWVAARRTEVADAVLGRPEGLPPYAPAFVPKSPGMWGVFPAHRGAR